MNTISIRVRRYQPVRTAVASLYIVFGLSTSCGPLKPDPPSYIHCSIVSAVPSVEMYVDFNLSLSPTGEKLLFVSAYGNHHEPLLSIMDLQTGTVTPTIWSDTARGSLNRQMPMLMGTRWTSGSDMPLIQAGATRRFYFLTQKDRDLVWNIVEEVALPTIRPDSNLPVSCDAQDLDTEIEVDCEIQGKRLTLRQRRPASVVQFPTVDNAAVSFSGNWLAYTFNYLDTFSLSPGPQLYLVNLNESSLKSIFTTVPIYGAPHWHPTEDRIYFHSQGEAGDPATRLATCLVKPPR